MTPRQAQVLAFVTAFVTERGCSPSYREIGVHIGAKSPSTSHALVHQLVDMGKLTARHRYKRSLEIAQPREAILADALRQCAELALRIDHPTARLIGMAASAALAAAEPPT